MQRKLMMVLVRKNETMQFGGVNKTRGMSKLTCIEIVRRDMTTCNLTVDITLNRSE